MTVTSTQRWVSIGLVLLFVFLAIELGSHGSDGWFYLALVLLAIGWLIVRLPLAEPDSRSAARPLLLMFEVPIAFTGEPLNVLWRLQDEGYVLAGHGLCNAPDHHGYVVLKVEAVTETAAIACARHALDRVSAHVAEVGPVVPV